MTTGVLPLLVGSFCRFNLLSSTLHFINHLTLKIINILLQMWILRNEVWAFVLQWYYAIVSTFKFCFLLISHTTAIHHQWLWLVLLLMLTYVWSSVNTAICRSSSIAYPANIQLSQILFFFVIIILLLILLTVIFLHKFLLHILKFLFECLIVRAFLLRCSKLIKIYRDFLAI